MAPIANFARGMGIGGWLTNYKRFHVLPEYRRMTLTTGDFEHFRTYITERDIAYIASLGMDHIRLGFDQIVLESAPGVYREEMFALLRDFVTWCRRAGVRAVLNLHKAIGNDCDIAEPVHLLDDEALQARFVALWEQIEDRFADAPEVAFELLNEVRDGDSCKWNALAARTLAALRKKNPRRTVIIGSTCWNSVHTLKDLAVTDDPCVIYTFHTYDPFSFTHQQGVLQEGPLFYNRQMPWPGDIARYRDYEKVVNGNENAYTGYTVMDRAYLHDSLRPALAFKKEHPSAVLWCGEFGTIRHCPIVYRENWMRDVIAFCLAHRIPYCCWNYLSTPNDGNRFSLVDDDTRTILSPRLSHILRGELDA